MIILATRDFELVKPTEGLVSALIREMSEEMVYLDTSAMIKRYVAEPGSEIFRDFYRRSYSGEVKISSSLGT